MYRCRRICRYGVPEGGKVLIRSPNAVNVFTYGTLMFQEVWSRVVRGSYARGKGTLKGYVRRRMRGELYPGLVAAGKDATVRGIIYRDVDPRDVARLDAFEGDCYEKRWEECIGEDGSGTRVLVYVVRPEHEDLLEEKDWDPARFLREGLATFIAPHSARRE